MAEPERFFLEGPHSRRQELSLLLGAGRDFIRGFRKLHFVGPCVTVFGSARFKEDHPYYALGRDVGGSQKSVAAITSVVSSHECGTPRVTRR